MGSVFGYEILRQTSYPSIGKENFEVTAFDSYDKAVSWKYNIKKLSSDKYFKQADYTIFKVIRIPMKEHDAGI